jgi:hypothetical protein
MREDKPERRQWLDENDFVWDDYERRWEDAQSALTTYKKLNGDMRVPAAFEVPSSAPWGELPLAELAAFLFLFTIKLAAGLLHAGPGTLATGYWQCYWLLATSYWASTGHLYLAGAEV